MMENGQRFSALYVRDFRLFWMGQIISFSGTWMHSVAQGWLVYSLTKSPLYLGVIASLSSLPILLFALVGGMVADRYPKRNIMIVTQILSIVPAAVIAVLADKEVIAIWHVGIAALFLGVVNAFDIPARQAFFAEVVGKADITNAIALNSAAFNGARIIGPVVAGFVISAIGIPACFYLNAVSFVPVIIALSKIKSKGSVGTSHDSMLKDISSGWGFVASKRPVFYIMALIASFSLFGIPYIALMPVLAAETLEVGAKGLSLLMASAGAGSLIAAMTIAFKGEVKRKDVFIPFAALVFSFAILLTAFSNNFYLSMFFLFCAGWGGVSLLAVSNSFIQSLVPDSLRGRVMSLYTIVFLGFAPIGNSLIGVTAHAIGATLSLKVFAMLCIAASIIFGRMLRLEDKRG